MEHGRARYGVAHSTRGAVGGLHHRSACHSITAAGKALRGSRGLGRTLNSWQGFQFALRGVLLDKGAFVPAVVGVLFYSFFYPLPYRPQAVQHVPVIVADYD